MLVALDVESVALVVGEGFAVVLVIELGSEDGWLLGSGLGLLLGRELG